MTDKSTKSERVSRRRYLGAIGAGTLVGVAGCSGGGGGGGSGGGDNSGGGSTGTTSGGSSGGDSYHIGFSIKNMNNPWLQVFRRIGELYGKALGHKVTVTHAGGSGQRQIQNIRSMMNSGIDALIVSPYSSDATVGVIEQAASQDIPVYTANSTAPTDAVEMFVGFGSYEAGYRVGNLMADAIKETYGGSKLVDLVGDQADQSAVRRSQGFRDAIKETKGVTVAKVIYNKQWSRQNAIQNLTSYLRTDPDVHGIYSVWGGGALAAVDVLKDMDMLYTVDNTEQYIPIMNIDGFPGVLDQIEAGHIHTTLQQPMPFYAPIAMEYILEQLKTGDATLPKAGSKVESAVKQSLPKQVKTKNFKYNGVKPLQEPYWSPAEVADYSSDGTTYYPWLKPKTVAIRKENVNAKYLWGNYASQILK